MGLPVDADARQFALRARAFFAMRRMKEATAECSKALSLAPNDTQFQLEAHRNRAFQHIRQRQFADAAAEFHQARRLDPEDSLVWRYEAGAHLYAGEIDAFRQVCRDMPARFERTQNAETAFNVIITTAILPDSLLSERRLVELTNLAATWGVPGKFIKGVAQYRMGDYEQALVSLQSFAELYRPRAIHLCFLAMCHHQLGHTNDARRTLAEANDWIERANRFGWQGGTSIDNQVAWLGWTDLIETYYPRREAESLINGKPQNAFDRIDLPFGGPSAPGNGAVWETSPQTDEALLMGGIRGPREAESHSNATTPTPVERIDDRFNRSVDPNLIENWQR
jgi:Flp pilus assembly protein TadD